LPSNVKERLHARIDSDLKVRLEAQANNEGMPFSKWLQLHLPDLLKQYPGQLSVEESVPVENPFQVAPPNPVTTAAPQAYGGYPYGYQYHQPDAIDVMVNDMRKLVMVKLMKELLQDKASPEEIWRMAREGKSTKEDFSMADMMKYNMMMQQMERQSMLAQQQLEAARAKGDKAGENSAINTLTALTTAMMQQSQNFMQQYMAMNQSNQNTQQTLFNTALSTNRATEQEQRQEREVFNDRLSEMSERMNQNQLVALQSQSNLQVEFLKQELERIRNDPKKDPFSQLVEFDRLRKESPVMDAALKAAFGAKEGGGIGELIPKLKELGIDKVVDKVASALGGLVMRPATAIPVPPPQLPLPSTEELEKLSTTGLEPLAKAPTETVALPEKERVELPERPDNVGYSNLEKQMGTENVLPSIEEKEPENIAKSPSESVPTAPAPEVSSEPYEGKVFTTGRPKGSRNKPKLRSTT